MSKGVKCLYICKYYYVYIYIHNNMKIVVFDMDETLGYFVEFGIFWDCLIRFIKDYEKKSNILDQKCFNNILDLYPEFLRPNIINILKYLKNKKTSQCCHGMMIYTNNQAPKSWANYIISYFESKINYKLFDQIISAFKINGKQIEICRTTHDKTYHDLVKCTKIPSHAEVCFLDDVYYPEMSNKKVFYINLKPYTHDLSINEILKRFMASSEYNKLITQKINFKKCMIDYFNQFLFNVQNKTKEDTHVDTVISREIMTHLQEFFNRSVKNKIKKNNKRRTNRHKKNMKNKTIKLRN